MNTLATLLDEALARGRYAYVLTADVHAAEDLVRDTLVKLAGVWRWVRREGNPPRLGIAPR